MSSRTIIDLKPREPAICLPPLWEAIERGFAAMFSGEADDDDDE